MAKQVRIRNISIPVREENGSFIPEYAEEIKSDVDTLYNLAVSINKDMPALIIGETGVGKTSVVRYLAKITKNNFRRLNLNGNTTVDEFVGKLIPDISTGKWKWQDGILIDAMRKGHWLLIDEINAALPEILFHLHSLLDDDKYVVLAEHDGEVVRPHKDFRLFATMNPMHNYAGTKELNKALFSRFPIVVDYKSPTQKKESSILKNKFPEIDIIIVENLCKITSDVRKSYEKEESTFYISTRDLVQCLELYTINKTHISKNDEDEEHRSLRAIQNAFIHSIYNKAEQDDKETLKALFMLYFGELFVVPQNLQINKDVSLDKDEIVSTLNQAYKNLQNLSKKIQGNFLSNVDQEELKKTIDLIDFAKKTIAQSND